MHLEESHSAFVPPTTTDLGTVDLSAPITEDRRHAIVDVCVHAVLATSAGPFIDARKLSEFIAGRFGQLFDGRHFDFAPVLRALLKIEGVQEQDLYVGIVNLMGQLSTMDVVMEEPRMLLDSATRQRLLDVARAATESARATFERRRLRAAVAHLDRKRLGDLMVGANLITPTQLVAALAAQEQHGGRLGTNLIEMGFVSPSNLAHFLSSQLELPCVTSIGHVERDVLELVPSDIAARHKVFPIDVDHGDIVLAMADPSNLVAIEEIERLTARVVRPTVAPELVITYALARYYNHRQPTRIRHHATAPRIPASAPHAYGLHDLASDFARAEDRLDILAMTQRYITERYATSAVFDVADGVVRGFSAAGVRGDAREIRSRFVQTRGLVPDEAWFTEILGIAPGQPLEILDVRTEDDQLAAILVGASPTARCYPAEHRRVAALTASALRMVELREEILLVADA